MTATIEGYERKCEAEYQAGLEAEEARDNLIAEHVGRAAASYAQALEGDGTYPYEMNDGSIVRRGVTQDVGEWLADNDDWLLDLLRGKVTVQQLLDAVAEHDGLNEAMYELSRREQTDDREAA